MACRQRRKQRIDSATIVRKGIGMSQGRAGAERRCCRDWRWFPGLSRLCTLREFGLSIQVLEARRQGISSMMRVTATVHA